MARRAIIIGAVVLGLILLANLILLAIYLPRLIKTPVSQVFPSPAAPSPIANSSPSIGVSLVPKRSAKPDGELVQRTEVSPSGNIKVNYVRRKGDPTRRIILESSASGSSETRPLFEHQRNAWVVISPNDEWIALNNRPQPGESHLQLYHQTKVDTLDYSPVEDLAVEGQPLENAVWTYYLETMGLPADTPREAATIDAVGWENDYTVAISVAVAPLADNDQVPPPWTCTFNIDTKEISASEETTQAVALQDTQPNVTGETAVTGSGAPGDNPLTGEFPGERFPATRLRPLEENEVSSWTGTNIRYAINELYARRGYDFSDNAEVRRQFARMSWYHPLGGSMEDIEKGFSGVEKHNVDLLAKFRPAKQTVRREGRAPRTQQSATPGPGQQFLRALRDGFGPPPRP